MKAIPTETGMSKRTAKILERSILFLCAISLVAIFQPFSLTVFGVGAGTIILAGLLFNLIPLCVPGRPLSSVVKALGIVVATFLVVALLAVGSAKLYGIYLTMQ